MPDYLRRRLLTAMVISPLWWHWRVQAVSHDLQRVVALDWNSAERLLALGEVPMAVADIHNYRCWVGTPALPSNTIDVGLRTEPNLELLTQLKPSLILCSQNYGPAPDVLERIAPVLAFSSNQKEGKPLTSARHPLIQLGEYLDLEQRAHRHLAEFDTFMAQMRSRLGRRFSSPLLLMSLLDNRHAIVFGQSSLFVDVLDHLGIKNAWQQETNFWGSAIIGLERLATMTEADVICFSHGDEKLMEQLSATALWQSFSFIRQQRFKRVPTVWFYGGTLTAMHFCHTLNHALET